MRGLLGNFHQGCNLFQPYNGVQCTAISLVALLFFWSTKNYLNQTDLPRSDLQFPAQFRDFSPLDVNHILFEGTRIYGELVHSGAIQSGDYVSHDRLPSVVNSLENSFSISYVLDQFYGNTGVRTSYHDQFSQISLTQALYESLQLAPHQLLTLGDLTIALYAHQQDHDYVIFDSHERNGNGLHEEAGAAVLLTFDTLDEMIVYLLTAYPSSRFDLTPVLISHVVNNLDPAVSGVHLHNSVDHSFRCEILTDNMQNTSENSPVPINEVSLSDNETMGLSNHAYPTCKLPTANESEIQSSCSVPSFDDPLVALVTHNHTYNAKGVKKNRKSKKNDLLRTKHSISSTNIVRSDSSIVSDDQSNIAYEDVDGMFVSNTVEIYIPEIDTDYATRSGHILSYETNLRITPSLFCSSCQRILYPDQCVTLNKETNVSKTLNIHLKDSMLCHTCHNKILKNTIPPLSVLNNVHVSNIPDVLQVLTSLEKKLISLIQVFVTMIILPGGQFAQKGLVLNLPIDVATIKSRIPNDTCSDLMLAVRFLHQSQHSCNKYFVSPTRMSKAFEYLSKFNHLYRNSSPIQLPKNIMPDSLHLNDCDDDTFNECVEDISSFENQAMIPVDYSAPQHSMSSILKQTTLNVPPITNKPVSIYCLPYGEEKAFPWLFPDGKFGFTYSRPIKIAPSMYFRQRLYNRHSLFRKNMTYLLHAAASYDLMLMKQEINIHMKMTKMSNNKSSTKPMTAGDIRQMADDDNCLRQNSYMFMKNIKGTVAYFKSALLDLLAMFRTLGPPTLFMTLSADDLHWPELFMSLKNVSFEEAVKQSSFMTDMRSDPLMAAIHFERRFKLLFKHVINGAEKPLGVVKDYFVRTEFQNRGSPHFHIFFWIEDVPLLSDSSRTSDLLQYLNKTIVSTIPSQSENHELHLLVNSLQIHHHSSYCQKTERSPCRFGFPKPEIAETRLLSHSNISTKTRCKCYDTRRSSNSQFVNPFNPTILKHWRANMDIQLISNAEGAAYYVCAYLCKSEPDELRTGLSNLISGIFKEQPNLSANQRMFRIGLCVLKHRRLSAQEAAFRLGNLPLIQSSRKTVNLNTRHPSKRFKMLKKNTNLGELHANSTDIFQAGIIDYYHQRPISMSNMCLYVFAAWHQRCSNGEVGKRALERFYIVKYDVTFRKRTKAAVIKFPKFPIASEDYFYSVLVLLLPHQNEDELLKPYSSAKEAFVNKVNDKLLDTTVNFTYFSWLEDVENTMRRIRMCDEELQMSDGNDLNVVDHNHDDMDHLADLSDILDITPASKLSDFNFTDTTDLQHMHSLTSAVMSNDQFVQNIKSLSKSQKCALLKIRNHFTTKQKEPFHYFISGGAGVGKTFLTKMIVAYLQLFEPLIAHSSPVVICAPTGTAARTVGGETIHSLLSIPVSDYLTYQNLFGISLNRLQSRFQNVHTIIIDEISMVSNAMMTFISRRLSEATKNDLPFGNLNILVVGDLYQIRPVKGSFVFKDQLLWCLFKPIFLTENMRQITDQSYANLLNRARVGLLHDLDVEQLKSRLGLHLTEPFSSALHIFPKRNMVDEFNTVCQNALNLHTHCFTFNAEHYFSASDMRPGADVDSAYIPAHDRQAGGLPRSLTVSSGSRVMLIRNIYTRQGLVNGAMGAVAHVDLVANIIYVKFDDESIGRLLQRSDIRNAVPIVVIEHNYMMGGRKITRKQFPLMLCWACTIHKIQGTSLDKAVVYLGREIFDKGMAYVALSRVRTLDGLAITVLDSTVISANEQVMVEYDRLRHL